MVEAVFGVQDDSMAGLYVGKTSLAASSLSALLTIAHLDNFSDQLRVRPSRRLGRHGRKASMYVIAKSHLRDIGPETPV
jgi:hypothetical protein